MSIAYDARSNRNVDAFAFAFDDEETDTGLIENVQEQIRAGIRKIVPGSPAARDWERFSALYTATIRRMAKACRMPPDETDELENETWVRVMKKLPDYRPDGLPRSFRSWLHTIARNGATDLIRRSRRQLTHGFKLYFEETEQPIAPGPGPGDAYESC